eukprot:COSAG01_NODE_19757_length_991_cov_1.274664_2_plen_23_part_01
MAACDAAAVGCGATIALAVTVGV